MRNSEYKNDKIKHNSSAFPNLLEKMGSKSTYNLKKKKPIIIQSPKETTPIKLEEFKLNKISEQKIHLATLAGFQKTLKAALKIRMTKVKNRVTWEQAL